MTALGLLALALAAGCSDRSITLAPTAEALTAAPAASPDAVTLKVAEGSIELLMEAPVEKIHGKAPASVSGSISVDPRDLTKTTGLLEVNLDKLELFQSKADGGTFGAETKSDLQNEHAKNWLEINPEAKEREAHKIAQFAIRSVEKVSERDATRLSGATRKLDATVKGELRLHGRKSQKVAELEVELGFTGDKLTSARVRTKKPLLVGLAEHDVHPRDKVGALLQKGLDKLTDKVTSDAPVQVDIRLEPAKN